MDRWKSRGESRQRRERVRREELREIHRLGEIARETNTCIEKEIDSERDR